MNYLESAASFVFLSPDVNACVFYNTSFWSIFFPVRKNIEIGLGLFDGTSVDEVKSIIAHEFGHFSQNSMKVGSTVYVTKTFISALCKIEVPSNKYNLYQQMLQSLVNEQKMVSNYFSGKDIMTKLIPNKEIPPLTFDCELSEPIRTYKVESRVRIEDIWASHPSLDDRIANASALKASYTPKTTPISSRTLIPKEISEKVSMAFSSIVRNKVQGTLSYISDEQFTEWASNEIKDHFMDERLRPFFGNTIFMFNLNDTTDAPLESPFTEENALKIAELTAAIEDWRLLNQIKNKEIDVKEVQVDGKVYNRKSIPFEKFKIELDIIHEKVIGIYSSIYAYVCSKCDEDKEKTYQSAFTALFYAELIKGKPLQSLFVHRDNLLNELNRATRRNENEYERLCSWVVVYEEYLKKVISELELDWIAAVIDEDEYINYLREYINSAHNSHHQIEKDAINEMFHITESLSDIQEAMYVMSRRTICDITTSVLDQ